MSAEAIFSIVVFVAVLGLIATEKIHRAALALTGAVILLLAGTISFSEAIDAIDWNTLGVLCGMMIFVAVVKHSGLFQWLAITAARFAKGNPWKIMVYFVIITAVLSAFLDNVTTVLLVGPMTLTICKILKLNPVPFFISQILASNVGGTATLIGDPPNIMLGSMAGLSFVDFLQYDAPCVIAVLIVFIVIFRFVYRKKIMEGITESRMAEIMALEAKSAIMDRTLFVKSLVVIALVVIGFLLHDTLHLQTCYIALSAAAIMLLIGGQDVEEAILDVEWPTIGFFVGLFIIVGAMEVTGVIDVLALWVINLTNGDVFMTMLIILWASAIFSAFLDNIPFVAAVIPIVLAIGATGMDVTPLWWAISLGACLGGNGTLIGASANVVLSGISNREGYPITFAGYFKIAFPMMLTSMLVCTVYLGVLFWGA